MGTDTLHGIPVEVIPISQPPTLIKDVMVYSSYCAPIVVSCLYHAIPCTMVCSLAQLYSTGHAQEVVLA